MDIYLIFFGTLIADFYSTWLLTLLCVFSYINLVVKHVHVPVKEIVKVPVHIPQPYPVEKIVHYPVHVHGM